MGRSRNITSLRHYRGLSSLDGRLVQKLLQLPSFDQLIEEGLQSPVILRSMTSVLMIMTVKILISLDGVSFHSIGPFKVGLILNLFQHLVDRLLKHQIYHLGPTGLRGAQLKNSLLGREGPYQLAQLSLWLVVKTLAFPLL